MAAENCAIEPGDTVAAWGCGPVGQFAIQSAWMFGAGRVVAIDRVAERLQMAAMHGRAETIDYEKDDVRPAVCHRYPARPEMTRQESIVSPRMIVTPIGRSRSALPEVGASGRGLHVDHIDPTLRIQGSAFV